MRPTPLDRLNLVRIKLTTHADERRRWSHIQRDGQPHIFYGHDTFPGVDEIAGGGLVKLQDLASRFPNTPRGANILYLISSALPYFPVRMATWAKEAGAKIVINQNGVHYPGWYGEDCHKANAPMRELLQLADHVVYQSEFCKQTAEKFLCAPTCDWQIWHNPVPTNRFLPSDDRPPLSDGLRALCAGSFWSRYRLDCALQATQTILRGRGKIHLTIAGRLCWHRDESTARSELDTMINDLELARHVTIIGPYTQQAAVSILSNCHLLLHTKVNDPSPRLVVEAMSCGLPVVYSDTGGVPELVGVDAGLAVPGIIDFAVDTPPDPILLAHAMRNIMDDYVGYSTRARARAMGLFDVREWLHRHATLFSKLANEAQ